MSRLSALFIFTLLSIMTACSDKSSSPKQNYSKPSSSSTSSSTSSTSSSTSSSSGFVIDWDKIVVSENGELDCNPSISENWPCSYNPSKEKICGCDYTSCGCVSRSSEWASDATTQYARGLCEYNRADCDIKGDGWFRSCSNTGFCGASSSSSSSTSSSGLPNNYAVNGDIENGIEPWFAVGDAKIKQVVDPSSDKGNSLYVFDRNEPNAGVARSIPGLTPNQLYQVSIDVKAEESQRLSLQLSVDQTDETSSRYFDFWMEIKGIFRFSADTVDPVVYLRGTEADIDFYVDSFSVKDYQRETEKLAISEGKDFYADKGCSSCHGTGANDASANVVINPHDLKKTTRANLATYIHTNMPKDAAKECENNCAISIAAYLLSLH